MSDRVNLAIKLNNAATNDPCELCGQRTDPELGPELFVEGTWALVCYECGQKHAPELMRCLFEYRNALRLEGFSDDFPGTAVIVDQGEDAPNVRHLRPVEEPPGDEGYLPLS